MFWNAKKKKSSISGGAKKVIGDLILLSDTKLEVSLLFFGAGGHDNILGILNLSAFGVEQTVTEISSPLLYSWPLLIFHDSLEFEALQPQCNDIRGSSLHLWRVLEADGAGAIGTAWSDSLFRFIRRKVDKVELLF